MKKKIDIEVEKGIKIRKQRMKRVKKEKLKDKKIEKEFREVSKKTKRMRILTSLKKKGNPKGKRE